MSKSTPLNQVPVQDDTAIHQEIDNVIGEFTNPSQFAIPPVQPAPVLQLVPNSNNISTTGPYRLSEEDTKLMIVCATIFVVFSIPRVTQLLFSHIPVQNDMAKLLIKALLFGAAVVVVMKFV